MKQTFLSTPYSTLVMLLGKLGGLLRVIRFQTYALLTLAWNRKTHPIVRAVLAKEHNVGAFGRCIHEGRHQRVTVVCYRASFVLVARGSVPLSY